jgi:hypothetical protein
MKPSKKNLYAAVKQPNGEVEYLPSGEYLSHHETESGAREAILRYRAADRRRAREN